MGRIVVIGAGIGGIASALRLAAAGHEVTVIEAAAVPGGKARHVDVAGRPVDGGPTVFTLRWVFDELLAACDHDPEPVLAAEPVDLLARHAWAGGGELDLHTDIERSAAAIAALAGAAEAARFRGFCARARKVYTTLERSFMAAPRPSMPGLVWRVGLRGLPGLMAASPFVSMWKALGEHFHDPRLRQLFGRYATYCGSSPWQAPSTLMLVAHAEQLGVWAPRDGMAGFARRLAACAEATGACFRFGAAVNRIEVAHGRAVAVVLDDGERLPADAVIANADPAAIAAGHFGDAARGAVDAVPANGRSLSAYVWCVVGRARGFPLTRHTVFFSGDYRAEFDAIFGRGSLPPEPTVYTWAADRRDDGCAPDGIERLMFLANAPAVTASAAHDPHAHAPGFDALQRPTDGHDPAVTAAYRDRVFSLLARCGLTVDHADDACVVTTPQDFARRFPGSAGALYGQPTHGWRASFTRGGARTRLPGLYLAGGGVHPGAGVPMVALSGRLAAEAAIADFER